MVVLLDLHAHRRHGGEHLAAHVLRRIERRDREVAALGLDAVAEIAAVVIGVAVRRQLGGIELEAGVVGVRHEAHVVEHEELGLRADIDRVADAGRLQEGLGLLGDAARVAVVGLARRRLEDVAGDRHRGGGEERVHAGGGRVGHEGHVRLVDRLPAGDRRAVEHDAVGEHVLVDDRDVEGHVLPLAARVGEPKVDVLDVVVLDRLEHVFRGLHGPCSPLLRLVGAAGRVAAACEARGARPQIASEPVSPVRMRMASSTVDTKILPSPMRPVWAARRIASTAPSTRSSAEHDLELHLRQEVDHVFGAPVELGVALLAAEALRLDHRDALKADLLERLLHLVELERLDDGFDLLHGLARGLGSDGLPLLASGAGPGHRLARRKAAVLLTICAGSA